MKQSNSNEQRSQSRAELVERISALLDETVGLDVPLVNYHLEPARTILELPHRWSLRSPRFCPLLSHGTTSPWMSR